MTVAKADSLSLNFIFSLCNIKLILVNIILIPTKRIYTWENHPLFIYLVIFVKGKKIINSKKSDEN